MAGITSGVAGNLGTSRTPVSHVVVGGGCEALWSQWWQVGRYSPGLGGQATEQAGRSNVGGRWLLPEDVQNVSVGLGTVWGTGRESTENVGRESRVLVVMPTARHWSRWAGGTVPAWAGEWYLRRPGGPYE